MDTKDSTDVLFTLAAWAFVLIHVVALIGVFTNNTPDDGLYGPDICQDQRGTYSC